MKNLSIRKALWSNLIIKCCSFILGFALWSFLSQQQQYRITHRTPVYFLQTDGTATKQNFVDVTLEGSRKDLSSFDFDSLAIFIDETQQKTKKITKVISKQDLLLPPYLNMIHCDPRIIELNIASTKDN